MSTSKIFVDPNEDLVFACAKVLQADASKVVLIIPTGANITSSQVSLKLLNRMLQRTAKLVVLVVEDELALRFAQRANLLAVGRVSDITADTWEQVNELKQSDILAKDQRKVELLKQRNTAEEYSVPVDLPVEVLEPMQTTTPATSAIQIMPEVLADSTAEKVYLGDFSTDSGVEAEINSAESLEPEPQEPEPQVEVIEPAPLFTKMEPKLVDLGGYAILAGGDVAIDPLGKVVKGKIAAIERFHEYAPESEPGSDFHPDLVAKSELNGAEALAAPISPSTPTKAAVFLANTSNALKTRFTNLRLFNKASAPHTAHTLESPETLKSQPVKLEPVKLEPVKPGPLRSRFSTQRNSGLTNANFAKPGFSLNRDYSRNARSEFTSRQAPGARLKRSGLDKGFANLKSGFNSLPVENYKQMLALSASKVARFIGQNKARAAILVIIPLIIFIFLSTNVFARTQIRVTVEQKSLPVSGELSASGDIQSFDLGQLTIPMRTIPKSASSSETVKSTGKGEKGEKAVTNVSAITTGDAPINLEAGTILSLLGKNNLDFKLLAAINLSSTSRVAQNIKIEAVEIGEQYNQSGTRQKDFSVKSKAVANLSIFTTSEIAGGSKQTTVVVSQDDINLTAADLTSRLKQTLTSEINTLISSSEVKLTEDIKLADPKVSSNKPVGSEVEEFDVTVSLDAQVVVVNKADLIEAAKVITSQSNQAAGDFKINNIDLPTISAVKLEDNTAKFTIAAAAKVTPALTEKEVKSKVLGLDPTSARAELRKLADVKDVKLDYAPAYVPEFLRRVPQDEGKIEVKVQ